MKPRIARNLTGRVLRTWNWLRPNVDLLMLAALALIAVGTWLLVELADEVLEGDTQAYDEWVLRRLRSPDDPSDPIGPAWFDALWRDVTALGSASVLVLVTVAGAGYLVMGRRYRTLALLLAVTVGGLAISVSMKALFARPRPEFISSMEHVVSPSFPSGHSMLSAVVYLTLGALLARTSNRWRYKIYFLTMALLLTLLVGISRVYLGVHYPTDVLAGWSAGLIWALTCWLIAYFLQRRGNIEPPQAAG
ncbi:MAG: phosphatase PAP2 family protein [Sedimentisphaerales bacterium]|nr:phosphatase PAP2 family protein [Sedimentisphaerales bacterium]